MTFIRKFFLLISLGIIPQFISAANYTLPHDHSSRGKGGADLLPNTITVGVEIDTPTVKTNQLQPSTGTTIDINTATNVDLNGANLNNAGNVSSTGNIQANTLQPNTGTELTVATGNALMLGVPSLVGANTNGLAAAGNISTDGLIIAVDNIATSASLLGNTIGAFSGTDIIIEENVDITGTLDSTGAIDAQAGIITNTIGPSSGTSIDIGGGATIWDFNATNVTGTGFRATGTLQVNTANGANLQSSTFVGIMPMPFYTLESFNVTCDTGTTGTGTISVEAFVIGNDNQLKISMFTSVDSSCTSNGTSFGVTGIPAALRPASTTLCLNRGVPYDNGSIDFSQNMATLINTDGTMTFSLDGSSTGWTNTNTKGWQRGMFCEYLL